MDFTHEEAMRAYMGRGGIYLLLLLLWRYMGTKERKTLSNYPLPNQAHIRVARSRNKVALGRDGTAACTRSNSSTFRQQMT